MSNFDKYTNYNDTAGVTSVVFGADSPILEVEMNEMQEIQKSFLRKTLKNLIGDGISDKNAISYSNGTLSIASGCFFSVGGYLLQCTGLSIAITDGTAYLQVWEETVDSTATLKTEGNEQSSTTIPNYIKDTRYPVETSKRKVIKYTLSTSTNSSRQNLAIASVSGGTPLRIVKEINLTKLSDKVLDIQTYIGYYDEGVMGVEVDLDNNYVKKVGENENWIAGSGYLNSPIYGGRKRCNVTDDGVIVAYYGNSAYTETGALTVAVTGKNGVTYPIGTKVQCMVMQPKFYYKRIPIRTAPQTGSYNVKGLHLCKWIDLISPVPKEGFKIHPAFKKGNTELDYYFIGENDGCVENNGVYDLTDSISIPASPYAGYKFSSVADAKPSTGATKAGVSSAGSKVLTRDAVRKMCANRGEGWQQLDITILSAEQMLFLIEYATFHHSETELGLGVANIPYVSDKNDSVLNPKNTTLGNGSGVIAVSHKHSNGNTYEVNVPVYRGVKNLFCNGSKYVDGVIRNRPSASANNEAYWQDGSVAFSDVATDHIATGFSWAGDSGFVKYFGYSEACDFMYIPSLKGGTSVIPVGSSYTTLMTKYGDFICRIGSTWSSTGDARLFQMDVGALPDSTSSQVTGRLCRKSANVVFAV